MRVQNGLKWGIIVHCDACVAPSNLRNNVAYGCFESVPNPGVAGSNPAGGTKIRT